MKNLKTSIKREELILIKTILKFNSQAVFMINYNKPNLQQIITLLSNYKKDFKAKISVMLEFQLDAKLH